MSRIPKSIIPLAAALSLGGSAFAETPEPDAPIKPKPALARPADSMSQAQLQEAFRTLRDRYIRKDKLDFLELNRAALEGLLKRLDFGAELAIKDPDQPETPSYRLITEKLRGGIGYIRPAEWTAAEAGLVAEALGDLAGRGVETLILDLRVPAPNADYAAAAQMLQLFCPANQLLFKIQRPGGDRARPFISKGEPRWNGGIICLIDPEIPGPAEITAAGLKHYRKALFIGEATPGRTVEYDEAPLGGGAALRFAAAEVIPANGEPLFQVGLVPDIESAADLASKHKVFAATQSEGAKVKTYITDIERPRLNEAALVEGTNPELPYFIARTAGKRLAFEDVPLQDRVLQRAIDFLTVREFLKLDEAPADDEKPEPADENKPKEEGEGGTPEEKKEDQPEV